MINTSVKSDGFKVHFTNNVEVKTKRFVLLSTRGGGGRRGGAGLKIHPSDL